VSEDLSEAALAALWRAGDRKELVTRIVRAYGPEILSYLLATLRGEGEASEAFSELMMNLWRASATFRGESSFRTWAYALARHAAGRVLRERGRRRRQVGLSDLPELDALATRVRSETLEFLRTERKDRVRALREALDPEEQTILILRVDRGFSWPDVARVLTDGEPPSADALGKKVVALRKRFERIKERLRRATEVS
jgi:RNA polymerase sigma-70 factor (ECF subfamily)